MVPEGPALDVTGDEERGQDLAADLREVQAKLEAARAEAAFLTVLLAVRTHQHDQTWRARQRLAAELDAAGARVAALTADRETAASCSAMAVAEADERTEAVRTVLGAVLASIGARALDRRRFQDLIARAGREAPDHGPGAARHAVLLTEARRVLGLPSQGS